MGLGVIRACKIVRYDGGVARSVGLSTRSYRLTRVVKLLRSVKEFRRLGYCGDFRPKAVSRTTFNIEVLFRRELVQHFIRRGG